MILAVIGSNGRMGQEIARLATSPPFNDIFSKTIPISKNSNFLEHAKEVDVVIDFSLPESTFKHLQICREHDIKFLTGVTGFSDEQIDLLHEAAKVIPVFWSPNTSIGLIVVKNLLLKAAKILDTDFRTKMTEIHHIHKKDSPSGTSIMLKNAVQDVRDEEIGIESIREGKTIAEHCTTFESDVEKIEINHRAKSRSVFAEGAIKCAIWLQNQPAGKLYNMNDFLEME